MAGPVAVPRTVFDGIEAVRRSGATNMLDRPAVARLARDFGYGYAAFWILTHRAEYSRALFHGFMIVEDSSGTPAESPNEPMQSAEAEHFE